MTDDQDARSIDFMPELNKLLLADGASFTNFFATTPVCSPSRATLLRGQYSHNHGVLHVQRPFGYDVYFNAGHEQNSLPVWLQQAGYKTIFMGKYLNFYGQTAPSGNLYVPPGWDEWIAKQGGSAYYGSSYTVNGVSVPQDDSSYSSDTERDYAISLMQQYAKNPEPFFMFINPIAPHDRGQSSVPGQIIPPEPAKRHEGVYLGAQVPRQPSFNEDDVSDKPSTTRRNRTLTQETVDYLDSFWQKRLESLLAVDEMVAAIYSTLEQEQILDNTYIFFSSDNGYVLGEHRLNPQKSVPYEESIRLPLIVRGPNILPGHMIHHLTSNVDWAPTILELAGVAAPDILEGRSLVSLMHGDSIMDWRDGIGLEFWEADGNLWYKGVRTLDYKYIEWSTGEKELYDLQKDPYELENLAATADTSLTNQLSEHVALFHTCIAETCRQVEEFLLDTRVESSSKRALLEIQVYPNPVHLYLTIYTKTTDWQYATIDIYNLLGTHISQLYSGTLLGEQSFSLDTRLLSPGVYYVRVNENSTTHTKPFIVYR
jgi:arylsulfatase A-like enzyme